MSTAKELKREVKSEIAPRNLLSSSLSLLSLLVRVRVRVRVRELDDPGLGLGLAVRRMGVASLPLSL